MQLRITADDDRPREDDERRPEVARLFERAVPWPDEPAREQAREASNRIFGVSPDVERPLPAGTTLGAYRVVKLLGGGGQAYVYEAEHLQLGRRAALKVPRRAYAARLLREARTSAQLAHPAIVKIENVVQEGERPFLIMELCPGGSLADRLATKPEGLPLDEVVRVATRVLKALDLAHRHGLVHRDIKPQNIVLDADGEAKLTDFGIGLWALQSPSLRHSQGLTGTATGRIAGTPLYMAPEQEEPDLLDGAALDGRADLFAFGKVLFEMLTGASPRTIRPPSRLRTELPPGWDEVVFRLLEERRERRFPDAEAVLAALGCLATSPKEAPSATPEEATAGPLSPDAIDALERAGFHRKESAQRNPALVPLLLLAFGACVAALLNLFVLPRFMEMFAEMALVLPLPTEIVLGHPWALWCVFPVAALVLAPLSRRSPSKATGLAVLVFGLWMAFAIIGVVLPMIGLVEGI
ncbi:protein kinase [Planctomycetota bacterium]